MTKNLTTSLSLSLSERQPEPPVARAHPLARQGLLQLDGPLPQRQGPLQPVRRRRRRQHVQRLRQRPRPPQVRARRPGEGSVQQSCFHLNLRFSNLPELLITRKNVPFHLNLHFNL